MNEATLASNEPHPMAQYALDFIKDNIKPMDIEAVASSALAGNRTAELCLSTWRRIESGEPVSDRYVMGLAWLVHSMREAKQWVTVDFDNCPICGDLAEILTDCKIEDHFYDGDQVRCCDCHYTGYVSLDAETPLHIIWDGQ